MASAFDLRAQHHDPDSKLVAGLERLAQALRVLLWEKAKAAGLSPLQVQFLVYLAHHPERDRRVSVLAQAFDLTKPTVSDAVSVLESKGYIARRVLEGDRRVAVLGLTPEGEALARELESWADPVKAQLQDLPTVQKQVALETVMHLIAALQEGGIITLARMCRTCRFFRPDRHPGGAPHHCALLDQPLAERELRLDCVEHQAAYR